jgi:hypothetical protein
LLALALVVLTLIVLPLIGLVLIALALARVAPVRRPLFGSPLGLRLAGSRLRLGGSIAAAGRDALLRIRRDWQGDQDRNEAGISHSSTVSSGWHR